MRHSEKIAPVAAVISVFTSIACCLPLGIAASIVLTGAAAPDVSSTAQQTTVKLNCNPQLRANQIVSLIMAGASVSSQPLTGTGSALTFQYSPRLPAKKYIARLQVDGVAGPVTFTTSPPAINGPLVTVPP